MTGKIEASIFCESPSYCTSLLSTSALAPAPRATNPTAPPATPARPSAHPLSLPVCPYLGALSLPSSLSRSHPFLFLCSTLRTLSVFSTAARRPPLHRTFFSLFRSLPPLPLAPSLSFPRGPRCASHSLLVAAALHPPPLLLSNVARLDFFPASQDRCLQATQSRKHWRASEALFFRSPPPPHTPDKPPHAPLRGPRRPAQLPQLPAPHPLSLFLFFPGPTSFSFYPAGQTG